MGGLFDALTLIGKLLMVPIGSFALKSELLTSAFKKIDVSPHHIGKDSTANKISKPWVNLQFIEQQNPFYRFFCYCCLPKNDRYARMIRKSDARFQSELDLVKFIERQRL